MKRKDTPGRAITLEDPMEGTRHSRCVEHVQVVGLREPVCILRGQDREVVLEGVYELLRGQGMGVGDPGAEQSHPTPRAARRPRTKGTTSGQGFPGE